MAFVHGVAQPAPSWMRFPRSLRDALLDGADAIDNFLGRELTCGTHLRYGIPVAQDRDRFASLNAVDNFAEARLCFSQSYGLIHMTSLYYLTI